MSKTIFLICGESGSGKTSVVNEVCKRNGYKSLISYTTRPCRGENDTDHIFITDEEVAKYEKDIVARTEINGYTYFSTRQQLLENDFYVIDYEGIQYLRNMNVPDVNLVTIYINLSKQEREQRVKKRGDDMITYLKRFTDEHYQFERMKRRADFDYSIRNSDFENTVKSLEALCKIKNMG